MFPNQKQIGPVFNPVYWSASPTVHHRLHDVTQKVSVITPSVEPCYFYDPRGHVAYLDVELPGVRKGHINIEVNGDNLCISGSRYRMDHMRKDDSTKEKQANCDANDCTEQPSFTYFLRFRLGKEADTQNICATGYEDGILTLTIPIKTSKESRKIPI